MFRVRRPTRSPLDLETVELTFEVSSSKTADPLHDAPASRLDYDGARRLGRSNAVQLAVLVALVGVIALLARAPGQPARLAVAMSGEPEATGSIPAPALRPTLSWHQASEAPDVPVAQPTPDVP